MSLMIDSKLYKSFLRTAYDHENKGQKVCTVSLYNGNDILPQLFIVVYLSFVLPHLIPLRREKS